MLKQSVSHDPSKCGLFVRPLRYKIAKGAKSLHLYVSLLLWTPPKCNLIYEKGDKDKHYDKTKADVETGSLCLKQNNEEEEDQRVCGREKLLTITSLCFTHMAANSC